MVLPIVFLPFILGFPAGLMIYWLTTNLWTTGQGIVTRRLMPRPVLPPKRSSRTPPKEATAAETAEAAAASPAVRAGRQLRSAPRRVKKKRGGRTEAVMSEHGPCSVEATGETVGEAKWAALRELEQLVPGLDRERWSSRSSRRASAAFSASALRRPTWSRARLSPKADRERRAGRSRRRRARVRPARRGGDRRRVSRRLRSSGTES